MRVYMHRFIQGENVKLSRCYLYEDRELDVFWPDPVNVQVSNEYKREW